MTEELTDSESNLLCPKCSIPLVFYRVFKEQITRGEDILDINYCQWDEEYVECPNCHDRPAHEWYNEEIVLA